MKLNLLQYFNLDNLTKSDIDRQYSDLFIFTLLNKYDHHILNNENSIIYESANFTTKPKDLIKELKSLFNFQNWQIVVHSKANDIELILLYADINQNVEIIENTLKSYGWSLGVSQNIILNDKKWLAMSFEPMFSDNIINEVKSNKFIFHWSPFYNKESILKNGLLPKDNNGSFKYFNRLHFLRCDTPFEEILHIGKMLYMQNKDIRNIGPYSLFGILTKDLPDNIIIKYDPRYSWGYIMNDKINANIISEILNYDFKNDIKL